MKIKLIIGAAVIVCIGILLVALNVVHVHIRLHKSGDYKIYRSGSKTVVELPTRESVPNQVIGFRYLQALNEEAPEDLKSEDGIGIIMKLDNPGKRRRMYEAANVKYDLGTYEDFGKQVDSLLKSKKVLYTLKRR